MAGRALPSHLLALALCTATACSNDREGPGLAPLQCQQTRIYYGSDVPHAVQLPPERRASIVAVFPNHRETICSGVIVASGVVVTAGHCVEGQPLEDLSVGTWSSDGWQASARDAEVHPALDVAVIWIDPEDVPETLEPIPLLEDPLDDAWLGSRVELAGHGVTEFGGLGQLRFASEPIVALNADTIVVDGLGESGACNGDSGGPLLAYDDRGRVRVIGVLDSGHASCVKDDHYTRVDVLTQWWSFDWMTPTASDRGCGGIDREGLCIRDRAVWCSDDDRIEVERCDGRSHCGQLDGQPGFACVTPEDDVCEGHGSQSWCEGGVRMRCFEGQVQPLDCEACDTAGSL